MRTNLNWTGCIKTLSLAVVSIVFVLASDPAVVAQANADYQVGTVMKVEPHQPRETENSSTKSYDVSVKVADTTYIVLVTPPEGSKVIEYKTGLDLPVRVDGNTMKFSDALGRPVTARILKRTVVKKQTAN